MASAAPTVPAPAPKPPPGLYRASLTRDSVRTWPLSDRIAYLLCWGVGIGLCLIAVAIVVFFAVEGLSYLSVHLLFTHENASPNQSSSGGILDPLEGTLILTAVAILIAAPLGVAVGVWLSEYARPAWLARLVESAVDMIAGTPDILLALFALVIFARPAFAFLSSRSENGAVVGKSFLTAGITLSLIAMPMIVGSTREALALLPNHLREASHALGKTRARTVRKVLLPLVRPDYARGATLGMGRIMADTAIVIYVLGATERLFSAGGPFPLSVLRGEGTTLTSYVYQNSPAGEGFAPQKAYAAAFVLLAFVVALNLLALFIGNRGERDRRSVWRAIASLGGIRRP